MGNKRVFQRPPTLPPTNTAQLWLPSVDPTSYVRPVAQPNSIINGRLDIWQRGTTTGTLTGNAGGSYEADRFKFDQVSSAGTPAQTVYLISSDVPSLTQCGTLLNYSAMIQFTRGAAMSSGDYTRLRYHFEGYDIATLIGGPVTLSFWVKASVTGIYTIQIASNANFSYIVEYQVNTANTWERKVFTFPFPPSSTTLFATTSAIGLYIIWNISGNQTNTGVPNVWIQLNLSQTVNQTVTPMATTGATWQLAGIKVEPGVIATPLPAANFQQELAKCQRYFSKTFPLGTTPANNGGVAGALLCSSGGLEPFANWKFPVSMRIAPVITLYNYGGGTVGQWQNGGNATSTANARATVATGTEGATIDNTSVAVAQAGNQWYIHAAAEADF